LPSEFLSSFVRPEPAHALQLQTLTTAGKSVFREGGYGLATGEEGPPIGAVEVRTGAVVTVSKGHVESNLLSLEYRGMGAGATHWLQFVWFEMHAVTPKGVGVLSGSIPTTSGSLPFTTNTASPSWAVDSDPGKPFYESGALAIRNSASLTMFDRPGGTPTAPLGDGVFKAGIGATSVTFTAHFDTYLFRNNIPTYHVPWAASTTFTKPKGKLTTKPVTYTLGTPGNVTALPANLAAVLKAHSPAFKVGP
jgi:hypothetical protein